MKLLGIIGNYKELSEDFKNCNYLIKMSLQHQLDVLRQKQIEMNDSQKSKRSVFRQLINSNWSVMFMLRLNVIVTDNGELDVQYENATVMSNDDVVLDSVSYDILMNELEMLQEQNEFLESICDSTRLLLTKLDKLPKWLQKLIEHFADK